MPNEQPKDHATLDESRMLAKEIIERLGRRVYIYLPFNVRPEPDGSFSEMAWGLQVCGISDVATLHDFAAMIEFGSRRFACFDGSGLHVNGSYRGFLVYTGVKVALAVEAFGADALEAAGIALRQPAPA